MLLAIYEYFDSNPVQLRDQVQVKSGLEKMMITLWPLTAPTSASEKNKCVFSWEILSFLRWVCKGPVCPGFWGAGIEQQRALSFCGSSAEVATHALRKIPMSMIGYTQCTGRRTKISSLSGQSLLPRQEQSLGSSEKEPGHVHLTLVLTCVFYSKMRWASPSSNLNKL